MTIGQALILAIQIAGACALGGVIGNWIVFRAEKKAVKHLSAGMILEDDGGGRWEVVSVSKWRHCIAFRLHSHNFEGKWVPAPIQTVMIAGADVLNDHKRVTP